MSGFGISSDVSTSTTNSSASGNQSSLENTRRLSSDDEAYVKDLLKVFGSGAKVDLSAARKNAIADTKLSVESLFSQYKDTALPQIMTAQQRTGGYGSTTAQALSNDAFAKTVGQAGQLQLNAINQYETNALNKSQQALSGFSTSLQALLQANETKTAASAFSSKSKSTTNSASVSGNFSWG